MGSLIEYYRFLCYHFSSTSNQFNYSIVILVLVCLYRTLDLRKLSRVSALAICSISVFIINSLILFSEIRRCHCAHISLLRSFIYCLLRQVNQFFHNITMRLLHDASHDHSHTEKTELNLGKVNSIVYLLWKDLLGMNFLGKFFSLKISGIDHTMCGNPETVRKLEIDEDFDNVDQLNVIAYSNQDKKELLAKFSVPLIQGQSNTNVETSRTRTMEYYFKEGILLDPKKSQSSSKPESSNQDMTEL